MPTTAKGSARRQLNDVYVCICYLREKLAAVRKGLLNIKQRNVFRQITVDIFVAQMTGRDGTCYSECSGRFCSRANCYVKPETACRLVLCRRFSIQGPYSATIYIFSRFLLFVNAASIASLCSEATYCFLEPADEATSLTGGYSGAFL